jgi:hypothetical protein
MRAPQATSLRYPWVATLLVCAACGLGAPSSVAAQSSTVTPGQPAVGTLGPVPSWQLNQGAPNTCSAEVGFFLPGVETNIPEGVASEQGVLSAPGQPNLGSTSDIAFGPWVGPVGFFVFAPGYSLPPNTLLTLSVTTYDGPNFTGGISHVSTITWNCTTGAVVSGPAVPAPALSPLALLLLSLALLALGTRRSRRWVRHAGPYSGALKGEQNDQRSSLFEGGHRGDGCSLLR